MNNITQTTKLFWLYLLSASIYFLQGVEGLPDTAFFFYLKENLNYSESQIMFLSALIPLAWLIKPVLGFFIDKFRFSKKIWILLAILVSVLCTVGVGIFTWLPLVIGLMILINFASAVRDVSNDGMMCVEGKKFGITGKIQSIQWIAITLASILVGVGGGWIAEHWSYKTAYLLLLPIYIGIFWLASQYKETTTKEISTLSFWQTLKALFTDSNLLLVACFIFLFKFAPSFGTPLTFIMRDEFGWSKLWIGTMATIGAVCSIIGAAFYYKYSTKLDLRLCLKWAVGLGATTTLGYLYFTPVTAVVYDCINGFLGMGVTLMLLDLMARNAKTGLEATSFALLCSVSNLANTADNLVGGWLFPIMGLQGLIIIAAFCSFLCFPLIKRIKV